MPDHRLKPLTPLGKAAPQADTVGPVSIIENTSIALASLSTRRGRENDVTDAAQALNISLPSPGHATDTAMWLSSDQWMIEAPFATHEDMVAYLKPAFGDAASITEQTDAWVRFDLVGNGNVGADLHAMFELVCNLDTRSMKPGQATRTVIEHVGCYVSCRNAGFTILGPRSSAKSLHHALITAAKSAY